MTSEQLVAVLGAITALVVALGAVLQQIISLRRALNGKLAELVETTRVAALKEGELRGRDHGRRRIGDQADQNTGSGVTS